MRRKRSKIGLESVMDNMSIGLAAVTAIAVLGAVVSTQLGQKRSPPKLNKRPAGKGELVPVPQEAMRKPGFGRR
jgi:hypothetical protein